jgi:hypothetical protein
LREVDPLSFDAALSSDASNAGATDSSVNRHFRGRKRNRSICSTSGLPGHRGARRPLVLRPPRNALQVASRRSCRAARAARRPRANALQRNARRKRVDVVEVDPKPLTRERRMAFEVQCAHVAQAP